MPTLMVGDLHVKHEYILPYVDAAIDRTESDRVVFLGDSCDDWGVTESYMLRALNFFAGWVDEKRDGGVRIDVLLGNHDFCYLVGRMGPGTKLGIAADIRELLLDRIGVQLATVVDGYLCSHAGLCEAWSNECLGVSEFPTAKIAAEALSTMFSEGLNLADFYRAGPYRGGIGNPSPLWADLGELCEDYAPGFSQIVGHTPIDTVQCRYAGEDNELQLWFCDTFSLYGDGRTIGDGSMLLVEDGCCAPVPFCPGKRREYSDVAYGYTTDVW